jgi:hypothetical protein
MHNTKSDVHVYVCRLDTLVGAYYKLTGTYVGTLRMRILISFFGYFNLHTYRIAIQGPML